MKGLEKEFEEFRKKEEKKHWHEWIVQFVISPYFFEEFEDYYEKIARFMTPDEVLEAVSKGLSWLDNASEDLERVVEGIAKIFGINPSKAHKTILASAL